MPESIGVLLRRLIQVESSYNHNIIIDCLDYCSKETNFKHVAKLQTTQE